MARRFPTVFGLLGLVGTAAIALGVVLGLTAHHSALGWLGLAGSVVGGALLADRSVRALRGLPARSSPAPAADCPPG